MCNYFFQGISTQIKAAVIFLIILALIVGILVGVYYALKKELCCCAIQKKEHDEESMLDDEAEEQQEQLTEDNSVPANGEIKNFDTLEETENPKEETVIDNDTVVGKPIVTESSFVAEKPPKRPSSIKSIIKKIAKPIGKVRFGGVSSKHSDDVLLLPSDEQGYGSLQKSDSMESFLSGISVVSENIEEFGSEVSPGRLQTTLEYDKKNWTLLVGVKQADCLLHTGKDKMYWQVHVTFLPFKKHRFKTKYKSTSTPIFNQIFEVEEIAEQALSQLAIRFRVYGKIGRTGKKKLAGETAVELDCMQGIQKKLTDWRILKRKKSEIV